MGIDFSGLGVAFHLLILHFLLLLLKGWRIWLIFDKLLNLIKWLIHHWCNIWVLSYLISKSWILILQLLNFDEEISLRSFHQRVFGIILICIRKLVNLIFIKLDSHFLLFTDLLLSYCFNKRFGIKTFGFFFKALDNSIDFVVLLIWLLTFVWNNSFKINSINSFSELLKLLICVIYLLKVLIGSLQFALDKLGLSQLHQSRIKILHIIP